MKILLVDNYDRGIYEPIVIAENVHPSFAYRIVRLLNDDEEEINGEHSANYYMVKEGEKKEKTYDKNSRKQW